ncbi:MAG TPA: type II secretion system protein [Phycisphaerae bacterium]|nr:type II secretion system protein [Phycisphaerae bacterium]HRY71477.1 type II secretion system protein [Phycisphaerae bacterium]HSA30037.1 type II secretion system protein [Phycisphaerae bacterium]
MNHARSWRPSRRTGGFTLLEVMIVVAVIALLVAILLPSLSAAREQSRRAICLANLKQLHLAWSMYLDGSQGRFPTGMNLEFNYGGLQGAGSFYFGSDPGYPVPKPLNVALKLPQVLRTGGEVFRCPSDKGTGLVRPTSIGYYGTSYYPNHLLVGRNVWVPSASPCVEAWNELVGDPWGYPPRYGMLEGVRRDRIDDPALVVLIGDSAWLDNWDEMVPEEFPYWHQAKAKHNFAFMDGHGAVVHIRKGIHTDKGHYSIIPFRRIREKMTRTQQEIIPP